MPPQTSDNASASQTTLPTCRIEGEWDNVFAGMARESLLAALPSWLQHQRWFAGKARKLQQVQIRDLIPLSSSDDEAMIIQLLLAQVSYVEGEPETYLLPLVIAQGQQQIDIVTDQPSAGLLMVEQADTCESATLCDASREPEFWRRLFRATRSENAADNLVRWPATVVETAAVNPATESETSPSSSELSVSVHGGEQSNSAAVIDGQHFVKLFRRLHAGVNPELEIGQFLLEHGSIECVPPLEGALEYRPAQGSDAISLAVVQRMVESEGDAWTHTLDELGRYVERVELKFSETTPSSELLPGLPLLEMSSLPVPDVAAEIIGPYLETARLLGDRTAEMHLALGVETQDPGFAPEPFSQTSQRSLYQSMCVLTRRSLGLLSRHVEDIPDAHRNDAERLLGLEETLLTRFKVLIDGDVIPARRIRTHGDFHLGQVLFTGHDFVIIDFEGEPDRPIEERRLKRSPLRDVAGMLRSFHYASHAVRLEHAPGAVAVTNETSTATALEQWLEVWFEWCSAAFLRSYLDRLKGSDLLPVNAQQQQLLLDLFTLEKAVYELRYELNNRPDWVCIPLQGILQLV